MTTPTKEQIDEISKKACLCAYGFKSCKQCKETQYWKTCHLHFTTIPAMVTLAITEWEKIRNIKRLRLEVGKTYIAKDGSEVKIIYESPVRCTGFLGIRATDGKTHPDDAIWYNPDGSHNEKYDGLTIISPK